MRKPKYTTLILQSQRLWKHFQAGIFIFKRSKRVYSIPSPPPRAIKFAQNRTHVWTPSLYFLCTNFSVRWINEKFQRTGSFTTFATNCCFIIEYVQYVELNFTEEVTALRFIQNEVRKEKETSRDIFCWEGNYFYTFRKIICVLVIRAVSYTHLTLPTIYSV